MQALGESLQVIGRHDQRPPAAVSTGMEHNQNILLVATPIGSWTVARVGGLDRSEP